MPNESFGKQLSRHPELVAQLYYWASEIVDDFDDWGPVIQANEDSVYDETTTIQKLRVARANLLRAIGATPPD